MDPNIRVKYLGAALPDSTDTENLYDSTLNGTTVQHLGVRRFVATINHDQAGTVKGYYSIDAGTNWVQFYTSGSLAAAVDDIDQLIEQYEHVKFDWVNGGTIQGTFETNMILTEDRSPST